jgi:hypothetical protein
MRRRRRHTWRRRPASNLGERSGKARDERVARAGRIHAGDAVMGEQMLFLRRGHVQRHARHCRCG